MRRIVTPMVGGMVSATVLTLRVIPAVFFLWKRIEFKNAQPRPSALHTKEEGEA